MKQATVIKHLVMIVLVPSAATEDDHSIETAHHPNIVRFNYRRMPAIALAKQVIGEGRIGRPFHYRSTYNQDCL